MKRLVSLSALLVLGLFVLLPMVASAQDSTVDLSDDGSFLIRANGLTTIAPQESVENALIINGDVNVAGTVEDSLIVINGNAVITGTVGGTVVVLHGDLSLEPGSTVQDVSVTSGTLTRADGANVTGEVKEKNFNFNIGRGIAVFSALWFLGSTVVALVAAALFAWLGREQLYGAVKTLKSHTLPSVVTAIVLWILLPLGALLILFSIVGAPLAVTILLVVLPILWLLGLIVVGTLIGSYIITPSDKLRAVVAAVIGTLIVSAASLIPFVFIITALAGMLGGGALIYRAISRARSAPDELVLDAPAFPLLPS